MEIASLVASIVSVIVAAFAIWLGITFFKMSTQIAEDTKEVGRGLASGVDKLEKLFDRLYSDTFSMMRDTVSDMRRQIWPNAATTADATDAAERKAEEKISDLREQVQSEISNIVTRVERTDARLGEVRGDIEELVDRAIAGSRSVDRAVRAETLRDALLQSFLHWDSTRTVVRANMVVDALSSRFGFREILEELIALRNEKMIALPDHVRDRGDLDPDTSIVFIKK